MNMKNTILLLAAVVMLCACHQTLDERIEKETQDYTRKECPKRLDPYTVLDSLTYTFNDSMRVHACYYSLSDMLDTDSVYNSDVVEGFRENVLNDIRTNLNYRRLREHGVTFAYHYRSATNPEKEYVQLTFTPEDYN